VCDRPAPHPVAFHSRGFGYVAEVFPPGARRNTGDTPRVYLYQVGYPGSQWRVDARRLWTAELRGMPQAALVSVAGHFVALDDYWTAGGERAVVVFEPDGRHVRSYRLDELLEAGDMARVEWSDCGLLWREGTRFYFSREPNSKLYIVLRSGRVVEVALATGALRSGVRDDFETLREILAQQYPNELAEVWSISLRFSSLTDMVPP
jgi:hypothetical protein